MGISTREKEKKGRTFKLEKYNDCNLSGYVPDFNRFNTVQLTATCWIKLNPEQDWDDLSKKIASQKFRIKRKIQQWKQDMFRDESIVYIKTSEVRRTYTVNQYLTLEIVLYTKPNIVFDRPFVMALSQPFLEDVIDEYIIPNEVYSITRNLKIESRPSNVNKGKKLIDDRENTTV